MPRFILVSLLVLIGFFTYSRLVFLAHTWAPPNDPAIDVFTQMEFSADQGLSWTPVLLPHEWQLESFPIEDGWYRHHFQLETLPVTLVTLYLPNLSQNVAAYLNGVEVGNGGKLDTPIARNWPRPLAFTVAPEVLHVGQNELLIWVISQPPGQGLLGPIYLGDRDLLDQAYANRVSLKVNVPMASVVILSIFSILLCTITLRRRKETEYAWGGAGLLFLAGHSLPMLVSRIPVSDFLWDWWRQACMGFAVVCLLIFNHRYLGVRSPRIERIAMGAVILSASIGLFIGLSGRESLYFRWGGHHWATLSILIAMVPTLVLLRAVLVDRDPQKILMMGAGGMLFAFGTHDVLFVMGFLSRQNGFLVHFASPVVALIFTFILFDRFVRANHEADELNRTLEMRISQKGDELASTYERVRRLEREAVISQERERFNRDLHDGLGGYLAGALAMAEKSADNESDLVSTLKDATEEMRLMIDSAEASGDDLGMILGTLRPKLERQLQQSGFELEWVVHDTQAVDELGPSDAMQLVRIAQESVSNAIKHSGGSRLRISLKDGDKGDVVLRFDSDGQCERTHRPGGHGMANLRQRARQLGCEITIEPCSELGGLAVILTWSAITSIDLKLFANAVPVVQEE